MGGVIRLALWATLLLASQAQAHDFWIEPSIFRPRPGAIVSVGLRVGQDFVGDPVPRSSRSIERFFVRQAGAEQPIDGSDTIDPAGWLRADGQTTALIGYRSTGAFTELAAEKFEAYLRQHGLEHVLDARGKRGESGKPGRERFYRYAKALLGGTQASAAAATGPAGFAYEIVPDDDPTARFGPFRGRVLYDGKPLGGALVVAIPHSGPAAQLTARSDAQGGFAFDLPRGGVWLVKSVHMVRAGFFSDADWESLWASLTFEMPAARP